MIPSEYEDCVKLQSEDEARDLKMKFSLRRGTVIVSDEGWVRLKGSRYISILDIS